MIKQILVVASLAIVVDPSHGQGSPSFRLHEYSINSGGVPSAGARLASVDFAVSLAAVGGYAMAPTVSPSGPRVDAGFASLFPPASEVESLWLTDSTTLSWAPESTASLYNVYRGTLASLPMLDYGSCEHASIDGTTVEALKNPPSRTGYFFLVTSLNGLNEEGGLGRDSTGAERENALACP